MKCDSKCLTCDGNATYCLSCESTSTYKYLEIVSNSSQSCVNSCKSGAYPDTTLTPITCILCVNNCSTCNTATYCLTCTNNHFLFNNTCLDICPNTAPIADNSSGKCIGCDSTCKTCSVKTTNCTSCNSPSFLYNNSCLLTCTSPTVYRP